MNVFIRVDASVEIGTGHVMRCLVLAEELRNKKVNVSFICHMIPGDMIAYIRAKGFTVYCIEVSQAVLENSLNHLSWLECQWQMDARLTIKTLSENTNIDWLIVDHYAFDAQWERMVKPYVTSIMVIDDLADRAHDCDVLLDQNLYSDMADRYENLVSNNTLQLLGPKYLLLRKEFSDRSVEKKHSGTIKRILISFGGSDPTNETMKAIKAVLKMNRPDICVDVVIGTSNQQYATIANFCESIPQIKLHYKIDYVADLMIKADLAIGAGGTTTWERCYLGLPAITIETATNQAEILRYIAEIGAIRHLGKSDTVSERKICETLERLVNSPLQVQEMTDYCMNIRNKYQQGSVVKHLMGVNSNE